VIAQAARFWSGVRRQRLPLVTREMIWLHLTKPWVPGFRIIGIEPLKPGLERYLGPVLVPQHNLFFPSLYWWRAHARSSHPPDGSGCSVKVHVDFLTPTGRNAEFRYWHFFNDDRIPRFLGREDFEAECAFWKKVF